MQESILIKKVNLVLENDILEGDIFIKNGQIQAIGPSLNYSAELIIADSGLTLLPGIIDTHVHFRDPGLTHKEDFASGSHAAVSGGVTTVFDMPNTIPPAITKELIAQKKQIASQKSLVNYNFFIGATAKNIEECNSCQNIAGIKLFMGSSTGSLLVNKPEALEEIFAKTRYILAIHAESEDIIMQNKAFYKNKLDIFSHEKIRNARAALEATKIAVELAKKYQKKIHLLHITSKEEIAYLEKAKDPALISLEVTPQHLLMSSPAIYEKYQNLAKINPPIRTTDNQTALLKALKNGFINTIATDHAPHTLAEKMTDFSSSPSGMPGIETSLPLMLNLVNKGTINLNALIKLMSHNPARIFNIKNKGQIKQSFDADLVLVDLKKQKKIENKNLYTKCGWSLFDGQTLTGWPIMTIVNGNIVFREGDFFTKIKGTEVQINV